jgi:hypothetical protein
LTSSSSSRSCLRLRDLDAACLFFSLRAICRGGADMAPGAGAIPGADAAATPDGLAATPPAPCIPHTHTHRLVG